MAKNRKNNVHYVDNALFLERITEYRNSVIAAKEAGKEKPRVPNYLGECFLKIANHLAYKSNFIPLPIVTGKHRDWKPQA